MSNTNKLTVGGWTYREQPAQGTDPFHLLLLIHGLKGNEDVMWVFARNLPSHYWILSPRAPLSVDSGGYSWVDPTTGIDSSFDDYSSASDGLRSFLGTWQPPPNLDTSRISLMGFSQGAALAFTFMLNYPDRVQRLAGLAGFLPPGAGGKIAASTLHGKHVYIAHGSRDKQVPVTLARESVNQLEMAGARVTYCEADTGHKLSTSCLRGLEQYFND